MTAPTPLAETIARAAKAGPCMSKHIVGVNVEDRDTLLACARRCEAIDSASHDKPVPWMLATGGMAYYASDIVPYFDAASERDALAKRLQLLDRVDALAKRVEELEDALSATVRALHEHGHKQEASTYYRYLPPLGTSNTPVPINDPTQGTPMESSYRDRQAADQEERLARAAKPSCVPADCQHYEQLPSGLWAWVEAPLWYIEDKGNTVPWIFNSNDLGGDYKHMYERSIFQATVSEPDFLAARALGARVLGWKA